MKTLNLGFQIDGAGHLRSRNGDGTRICDRLFVVLACYYLVLDNFCHKQLPDRSDQHFQATVHFALSRAISKLGNIELFQLETFSTFWKNCLECRDLNPEQLGEKRTSYLWTMPPSRISFSLTSAAKWRLGVYTIQLLLPWRHYTVHTSIHPILSLHVVSFTTLGLYQNPKTSELTWWDKDVDGGREGVRGGASVVARVLLADVVDDQTAVSLWTCK